MKRWVTADWHLGEDRFAIMQRPFTSQQHMVDTLRDNHNALVAPDDVVFVLGDVCYQKTPEFLSQVADFNGSKILVRGNHDRGITDEQFKPFFEKVVAEGRGLYIDANGITCYLTHYPSRGVTDAFNLVGHIHGAWKYQLNSLNVGVDANHFIPHEINEAVPFFFKAICEFYDDDAWAAYLPPNVTFQGQRGKKGTYFP